MKRIVYILLAFVLPISYGYAAVVNVSNATELANSLAKGADIVLEANIAFSSTIGVAAKTESTIDLNKHTITCPESSCAFSVKGKLTIIGEGNIVRTYANKNKYMFEVGGDENNPAELTIKGGHISFTKEYDSQCDVVRVFGYGTLNVYDGTISSAKSDGATILNNNGTVNIFGGTITNANSVKGTTTCYAISNINEGAVTNILGGNLSSDKGIVYHRNKGIVNVSNAVTLSGTLEDCDTYILSDTKDFNVSNSFKAKSVSYDRGSSNPFGAVCLPFAPTDYSGITFYTIGGLSEDETEMILEEVNAPEANVPYVYFTENNLFNVGTNQEVTFAPINQLSLQKECEGWTLQGIYERKSIPVEDGSNKYYIKGGAVYKAVDNFTSKPFRCYFIGPSSVTSPAFDFVLTDLTNLDSAVSAHETPVAIYDLNGNKLKAPQKGVNVVKYKDGKTQKIIVR